MGALRGRRRSGCGWGAARTPAAIQGTVQGAPAPGHTRARLTARAFQAGAVVLLGLVSACPPGSCCPVPQGLVTVEEQRIHLGGCEAQWTAPEPGA